MIYYEIRFYLLCILCHRVPHLNVVQLPQRVFLFFLKKHKLQFSHFLPNILYSTKFRACTFPCRYIIVLETPKTRDRELLVTPRGVLDHRLCVNTATIALGSARSCQAARGLNPIPLIQTADFQRLGDTPWLIVSVKPWRNKRRF